MNHRGPWLRKPVGLCEVLALAAVLRQVQLSAPPPRFPPEGPSQFLSRD